MTQPDETLTLEPTTGADADALADLRVEAMRESLERIGRFDAQRARQRFLDGFDPATTRWIASGGERVGLVTVTDDGRAMKLDHLYIRPSHQGRGIGGWVLRGLFELADARGLPLRVGALKGSDSNRFYASHGFVLDEEAQFDNYYVRECRTAA